MDFTSIFIILVLISIIIALIFLSFSKKNISENAEKEARYFAKLLIAEIRLYEPYKYERGLKNNNLYESLEIEITEARKKFRKRFPDSEFEIYFDETILNVLANDDKSKLGIISNSEN